jgi:alcohol dehydrogenase
VPASIQLSENVIAPGGTIANIGMNGMTIDFHMERFWSNSITTTTRVVDTVTTPRLLKTVASGVSNRRNLNSTAIAFSTRVTVGGHHRGLNVMATNTGINRYTTLWDEDWP